MLIAYTCTRPGRPTEIEIASTADSDFSLTVFKEMAEEAIQHVPGVAVQVVGIEFDLTAIIWLQRYDSGRNQAISQLVRDDLTRFMIDTVRACLRSGSARTL